MSAGIIRGDSAPTNVRTQRGPSGAVAQQASNCPSTIETVKVKLQFVVMIVMHAGKISPNRRGVVKKPVPVR